ncbi:phosphate transport protein [Yersinia enterocolitica]|nr:phosphate transport protein [Yersinia enterocolitica]CNG09796.1 phosphate transport protein [Yersinia enterocolitica]
MHMLLKMANSSAVMSKKVIFSFSPPPIVTDNAPRSCPQTGVTLMLHLFAGLDFHTGLMLVLALLFVLFYEAINGFHDTANAVATVIYTRAMRSQVAVVMAGVFNFLGVMLGGLSVAYAIVHLLPTDLLLNVSSAHGLAMVFSMLLAAIIWNLGTWYFGIPASSSHTLIGAIIGIGLTNALMTSTSVVDALNVPKMIQIFLSLILSPIVGLVIAGLMVFLLRRYWNGTKKQQRIHLTPAEREKKDGKRKPPFWTRTALILSAIGVSFSHGANDGQKGIGLIMLVLIGVAPAGFVVNMNATGYDIARTRDAVTHLQQYYQQHVEALPHAVALKPLVPTPDTLPNTPEQFHCDSSRAMIAIDHAQTLLANLQSYDDLTVDQRSHMRRLLMCVAETAGAVAKLPETSAQDRRFLNNLRTDLLETVEYAPTWIIVAVALALSLGTMVGWKRVAVTIGEKIGKKGMTYAQGVSAQMTAAVSIGIASYTGMPVSTTQVLSSAVAGTMLVDGGGVQSKTVKNIMLAWVLTLPISILLSGGLYWIALKFI